LNCLFPDVPSSKTENISFPALLLPAGKKKKSEKTTLLKDQSKSSPSQYKGKKHTVPKNITKMVKAWLLHAS